MTSWTVTKHIYYQLQSKLAENNKCAFSGLREKTAHNVLLWFSTSVQKKQTSTFGYHIPILTRAFSREYCDKAKQTGL